MRTWRFAPSQNDVPAMYKTPMYGWDDETLADGTVRYGIFRITNHDYVGEIRNCGGYLMSKSREIGDIPDCIPAPHDKSWLEVQGIREQTDVHLYLLAMHNLCTGNYRGSMPRLSKYWDTVKNDNGIGHNKYPGMA